MTNPKILLLAVALVIVAAIAFVLLDTGSSCCEANSTEAVQSISPSEYQDQFAIPQADHLLIDVRTPDEFASGHLHGAVNIPVESLASRLSEVPNGQPIIVYCRSGNRSATASQVLAQAGYSSIYDLGGINDWITQGLPVE